jgi:hypothetical protein
MRPCGDCRLCCKVFPLPVLEKPAGAWCRYSCAGGCAIHGLLMPEVCRRYDCFWREHDDLLESWRPDRIGIVVTESGNVTIGCHPLPVVLFEEDIAGASRCEAGREMLDRLISRGFAVMIIHGMDARIEFDGSRYPGVTVEEIESALRHRFSQDAELLKQLGAVGEDFR